MLAAITRVCASSALALMLCRSECECHLHRNSCWSPHAGLFCGEVSVFSFTFRKQCCYGWPSDAQLKQT